MAAVTAADLVKQYRDKRGRRAALDGVSFAVADGQTLVILGPSGSGKSTLLRVVAGLDRPDAGRVRIGERDVTAVPPERRRVGLVFQEDALFPHLSIYDNLAFALRSRGDIRDGDARIRETAQMLEIEAHLRERPARLSGGERQRAAIARAVLSDPLILLFDEPFAHLDPQLRTHVREQLARFRDTFAGPVVYVTHDHLEALSLADRLAVMIDGRIVQCDDPQQVYDFPCDVRVARFFGSLPMNLLETEDATIGIRPEYVQLGADGVLGGQVVARERAGADWFVHLQTPRGRIVARVPLAWQNAPAVGDAIGVRFPPEHVREFDRATGQARR